MNDNHEQHEQAVRYLLGELAETDRSAVEDRFFIDENYSRFLDAVEDDLIDAYAGRELSPGQVRNFERNFLVSERRRRAVRRAQILRAETQAGRESSSGIAAPKISLRRLAENLFRVSDLIWAGGFAAAAAAILLLLGVVPLFGPPEDNRAASGGHEDRAPVLETAKQSPRPPILPSNNENLSDLSTLKKDGQKSFAENKKPRFPEKLKAERRGNRPTASSSYAGAKSNSSFTLLPPAQVAEKTVIVGSPDTKNYRFRVVHNNAREFVSYRVEIRAADGDLIWSREVAVRNKKLQKPLALAVRSGALGAGAYGLTMSGATSDGQLEEINSYNFSIEEK